MAPFRLRPGLRKSDPKPNSSRSLAVRRAARRRGRRTTISCCLSRRCSAITARKPPHSRRVFMQQRRQQPPSRQLGCDQVLAYLLRELDLPTGCHAGRTIERVLWSGPAVPSTMRQSWTACDGLSDSKCGSSGPVRVCPKSSWPNAPICSGPTLRHRAWSVRPDTDRILTGRFDTRRDDLSVADAT